MKKTYLSAILLTVLIVASAFQTADPSAFLKSLRQKLRQRRHQKLHLLRNLRPHPLSQLSPLMHKSKVTMTRFSN